MRFFLYLFWLIVIIIGITFASLNAHVVTVNYYLDISSIPLALLLLIALAIGALLGVLALMPVVVRTKRINRSLRRQVDKVQAELKNLSVIPAGDEQ